MLRFIAKPSRAIAFSSLLSLAAAPLLAQEAPLYRVKCGNEGFIDKAGHIWEADAHYVGGGTFKADSAIAAVDNAYIYGTERFNNPNDGNLKYTFPVRAGDYKVILHFAEIWDGAYEIGKRVFDVHINGTAVIQDLDVFAQVGANTPLVLDFLSTAVDGKIDVEFFNKAGHAKIAGIEVLPVNPYRASAAPYRIFCGGGDWMDPQGNWWEGDGHYSSGSTFFTRDPVTGTDMSYLYQSERWNGSGDMAYSFDVAPGPYLVRLHFAEIYFSEAGKRIFDVDINGTNVIQALDLAADPGPDIAVVKEFAAEAVEGKVIVSFRNQVQNAKIAGIEILPAATVSARPDAGLAIGRKAGGGGSVDLQGRRLRGKTAQGYRIPAR